jgi:hypothetical protein
MINYEIKEEIIYSDEELSTIFKYPGGQFNWWKKPA